VQLDSRMDDPHGAIAAYGRSVALLSEVMERVMAGENTERRRPSGRRASVAAQEDEIRRLKSIVGVLVNITSPYSDGNF
jgi:hypothetical protein